MFTLYKHRNLLFGGGGGGGKGRKEKRHLLWLTAADKIDLELGTWLIDKV